MMQARKWLVLCGAVFLAACASDQVLTQEEMRVQNAADAEVAKFLFDRRMDELTSYNVRKDGFVIVKFHDSVQPSVYNDIVRELRKNPAINGVYAEKSGVEVCPAAR